MIVSNGPGDRVGLRYVCKLMVGSQMTSRAFSRVVAASAAVVVLILPEFC